MRRNRASYPLVKAWISARPTFWVVELTEVTVNLRLVTVFAGNVTVSGDPSLGSAPTVSVEPSLKVIVPAVT
jgi:hypothetical protein